MAALLGAVAPLAVLLEGGYNLSATAAGCEATLRVLLGGAPGRLPAPAAPSTIALLALQEVVRAQVGALPRDKGFKGFTYPWLVGPLCYVQR